MGWRCIFIEKASRLNYKLNNIGVDINDEVIWISLDEIDTIIVEDNRCNISIRLLTELSKKGISLIICDESHMPCGNLASLVINKRSAKYSMMQTQWKQEIKQRVWQKIIQHKIFMQLMVLSKNNKTEKINLLTDYVSSVEPGDVTNREGHAAKVYFRQLFGNDFVRERNAHDLLNSSLNFLYQVVRSKISQEIISHGYLTFIAMYHKSEYNYFSLADDLIEVFRPIVDDYVLQLVKKEEIDFLTPSIKEKLLNFLFDVILIDNKKQKIIEAIKIYTYTVLDALTTEDVERIFFPFFLDE